MAIDLDALEATIVKLEADAVVMEKIVNDLPTATNPGEDDGTVTTRLGDVVKNAQKVLEDLEESQPTFKAPVIETEAATSYTTVLADKNKWKSMTAGTGIIFTVNVGIFSVGDEIVIEQNGAGVVTIAGSVNINSLGGLVASAGQYAVMKLKFKSATAATLSGNIA